MSVFFKDVTLDTPVYILVPLSRLSGLRRVHEIGMKSGGGGGNKREREGSGGKFGQSALCAYIKFSNLPPLPSLNTNFVTELSKCGGTISGLGLCRLDATHAKLLRLWERN